MSATSLTDGGCAAREVAIRTLLPVHIERLAWDRQRVALHQTQALRALLGHAITHSPFHRPRLDGIDPAGFELEHLATLPTMTKREMMASLDDVFTDARLKRQTLEKHLAQTTSEPSELLAEYLVLASGGSSGERGLFVYSRKAAADYMLGLKRAGMKRLLAADKLPAEGLSMAMVAARSAIHATRAFSALFSGGLVTVTSISAIEPLDSIVNQLNDLQPALLQGYPFVLDQLAEQQRAGRLRIAPVAITANSEQLAP